MTDKWPCTLRLLLHLGTLTTSLKSFCRTGEGQMCGTSPKSHLSVISHSSLLFPFSLLLIVELWLRQLELFSLSWPIPRTCFLKRGDVLVHGIARCCHGSRSSCLLYWCSGYWANQPGIGARHCFECESWQEGECGTIVNTKPEFSQIFSTVFWMKYSLLEWIWYGKKCIFQVPESISSYLKADCSSDPERFFGK